MTRVTSAGGVRLRVARWRPTGRRSRGTVVVLQGRAEFIEKYFEVVAELRRRGFAVVAFDWRGQGGSDRLLKDARKGHVDDFEDYAADLAAVMEGVVRPYCPGPVFALAHSMGGCILLRALRAVPDLVERAVLSAPMIEISGLRRPRRIHLLAAGLDVLGLGGSYIPGGGRTAVNTRPFVGNPLTLDADRYARTADIIAEAPDLALGDPTIGWVHAAFRAMDPFRDPNYPLQLTTPMLIMAGGADSVTVTPAAERFAARLKAGRAIVLPGAMHELLVERDWVRGLFWTAFDAFIPGSTPVRDRPAEASTLAEPA
ncbi:alpha/beta hydrolase [Alsobacter soli]|uniref:Alpha/beta hydrolase n=1 Tax=Alsobacter soli TaxID=2109933 RepID=A0A2T1HZI9_9HYPH|nr:alpha/beta hydrolase [Alsobacter soli]PSC07123.1 alpha/beta hydrolase [Alsobacter soli]